ncbi:MAG: hypothetical protein P8J29_04810 [Rhodospirillales bacterium]|nr:hypothetical protein [Rhodospirillales bacterium]
MQAGGARHLNGIEDPGIISQVLVRPVAIIGLIVQPLNAAHGLK